MVIFHCYVSSPEGISHVLLWAPSCLCLCHACRRIVGCRALASSGQTGGVGLAADVDVNAAALVVVLPTTKQKGTAQRTNKSIVSTIRMRIQYVEQKVKYALWLTSNWVVHISRISHWFLVYIYIFIYLFFRTGRISQTFKELQIYHL